jgi:hypothetical protein
MMFKMYLLRGIIDPCLLHHFIVSTNIDTPDQGSIYLTSLKLEFYVVFGGRARRHSFSLLSRKRSCLYVLKMALSFIQTHAAEGCFVPFTASSVTSINHRYIKTRAYSDATLCKNCKAIGEELSEI